MVIGEVVYIIAVLVLCGALALGAYIKRILDLKGSILGFIMGAVIGVFGHITWVILLLIFLVGSLKIGGFFEYQGQLTRESDSLFYTDHDLFNLTVKAKFEGVTF